MILFVRIYLFLCVYSYIIMDYFNFHTERLIFNIQDVSKSIGNNFKGRFIEH
jgi:hypothetical protein